MKAYAIFEGGGAKGYAHVGALKAAEERGIVISAVAGTSIGAVIAAFIAAGYTADELYSMDRAGNPCGILALDPLDKLDKQDWERFEDLNKSLAQYAGRPPNKWNVVQRVSAWIGSSLTLSEITWRTYLSLFLVWGHVPFAFRKHRKLLRGLLSNLGFTTTNGLKRFLDQAIRQKLNIPADREILFSDLAPLKVIAADLVTEDIIVFPRGPKESVSVVDAVVASASFPIFFQPTIVGDSLLIDGGVLSNRPAWVFDEERKASNESMPTFCFLLVEPLIPRQSTHNRKPASLFDFVLKLARTTIFGRKHLETRGITDYYAVEVAANAGVLSLKEAFASASNLVQQGKSDASKFFSALIGPRDPATMKRALELLSDKIYEMLRQRVDGPGDIRCAVLVKSDSGLARISYASYEPSADHGVVVSLDSPGPASCFRLKQPILTVVDKIPSENKENAIFRFEHALRAGDVALVYSLPIFRNGSEWSNAVPIARSDPIGVLSVLVTNGSIEDVFRLPEIEDILASLAQVLSIGLDPMASYDWLNNASEITIDYADEPAAEWVPFGESGAYLLSSRIEHQLSAREDVSQLLDQLGSQFNA